MIAGQKIALCRVHAGNTLIIDTELAVDCDDGIRTVRRFAHDITQSVRPLPERLYDIRHWSEFERGGHFAAMEVPELLAEDVRDFFLTNIK